jgi:hypothetical protein
MIIFVTVNFKRLLKQQRTYHWPRPQLCPRCQANRLWGHGFVLAYFDDLTSGVYLRRYRCADCGCVIRLRPRGYFKRFQAAIGTIRCSLQQRLSAGRYLPGISISRQRHWLNGLKRSVKAYLGDRWDKQLLAAFDHLLACGRVPVGSAI